MSASGFHIRPAKEEDIDTLLGLVKELAIYEKAEESANVTPELSKQNLFTTPFAHAPLAVSLEGQAVAFTLYYFTFLAWTGRPGLYLGDLFVKEGYQSNKLAKKRLDLSSLASIRSAAKALNHTPQNCARMDWTALEWNTLSRNFYEKGIYEKGIGAHVLKDASCLRLEEGIEKLKKFSIN